MNDLKFYWNETKSKRLKRMRGVSFEELITHPVVDVINHPSREGQLLVLFWVAEYVWVAPAVPSLEGLFLKTLYASRKHHRLYLERKQNEKED